MELNCPVRCADKLTNNLTLTIKVAEGMLDVALPSNKHLALNILAVAGNSANLFVATCRATHARPLLYVINAPIISTTGGRGGFVGWSRRREEVKLVLVVNGRKGVGNDRTGLVVKYRNDAAARTRLESRPPIIEETQLYLPRIGILCPSIEKSSER